MNKKYFIACSGVHKKLASIKLHQELMYMTLEMYFCLQHFFEFLDTPITL